MTRIKKFNSNGFTLIEVLISIVILSIGILGTLNLQSRALMDNQDAYLRTQAIVLAYDMSDRVRANAGFWGTATTTGTTEADHSAAISAVFELGKDADPAPLCSAPPPATPIACSGSQMATYDINHWLSEIGGLFPNGAGTIVLADDPHTISTTKDTIKIEITWNKANDAALNSQSSYSLDVRL